jgi:hypothetical protein
MVHDPLNTKCVSYSISFQTALNSFVTHRPLKEQFFDTRIFRHKKSDLVNAKVVQVCMMFTHTQSTYNGLMVAAVVRKKIMPVTELHSIDHCTGHGVTK